ncbi:acyl-CoA dehydrogenase [bacterium CG17_big_fil_post_rev_8_21_14_2_50_64_8]|nr:MAG: acyl-CoA dehydrogenase [bacterium CG17_big_fil_post_rev_8_21_14_2_50_64_8]PJA73912.1 MAG: acyl-CoA dehydrogenase [bacterium CG_4_9_14_3_um_filter_65_15]
MADQKNPTGGEFLLRETAPQDVFTPEDFSENQRMFAQTVEDFVIRTIEPVREELEYKGNTMLGKDLLKKAAEMGLLMADIPEAYGGMGSDKATIMLISEKMAESGSFAVTHGAQSGIGTLPIVYFGTEEQKKHYLPRLATADLLTCYALTEPGSGSDALAAATTAKLTDDGKHYVLNGTKQYISNAGYAEMVILFAKIDGDKFTGFIVDLGAEGVTIGAEEKKMGFKGSSTCAITLEDVKVPVENLLGEVGKGHRIAFNILNVGRFKLGASTVGGCKLVLKHTVPYTKQRHQFGQPLCNFGLIRRKIAEVTAHTFVAESMVYRTAGLLDDAIATLDKSAADFDYQSIQKVEDFSIECSMIKVFATEAMALAAEEGVQMLGGYGYCQEYPLERYYRDERVNRIFEGTNEINRMIIPGMIMKKAMTGELPFLQAAQAVAQELTGLPSFSEPGEPEFMEEEGKLIANMKKVVLAVLGLAAQKFGQDLKNQQEVLADCADIIMQTYACESGWLRTLKKSAADGGDSALAMADMLTLYVHEAMDKVGILARNVLAATVEGDELRTYVAGLRRLAKHDPVNRAKLHDAIAARIIDAECYTLK